MLCWIVLAQEVSYKPPTTAVRRHSMASWADIACCRSLLELMLGWLPSLSLWQTNRRNRATPETLALLRRQLTALGLALSPAVYVPAGACVQLLRVLALEPLLRFDDAALTGAYWHGCRLPELELRVAVRYLQHRTQRTWAQPAGNPTAAARLHLIFPQNAFARALEVIALHGTNLRVHRIDIRRLAQHEDGSIEPIRVRITMLHCVLLGFEAFLRCMFAHAFDPADSSSDTNSE